MKFVAVILMLVLAVIVYGKDEKCADANAHRKEYGNDPSCQINCEDIKNGVTDKICNRRLYHNECYCNEGYVPINTNEKCVKKADCPK